MMGGSIQCLVTTSASSVGHEDKSFVGWRGSGLAQPPSATRRKPPIIDEISGQGLEHIDTFVANSPFAMNGIKVWAGELKALVAPTQPARRIALRRQASLDGTFNAKTKDCSEHHSGLVKRS